MATATLHTLPLGDDELAMLKDLVVEATDCLGYSPTGRTEEDAEACESRAERFAHCAAVLRMVLACEAIVEPWLPEMLRAYKAEVSEYDEDPPISFAAFVKSCEGLLWRCAEEGGDA
jgi:hypothetical protein